MLIDYNCKKKQFFWREMLMYKEDYLEILLRIENTVKHDFKFDYDNVLDGTYNFNVNEVSILYELLHIIEKISSENNSMVCIRQDDKLIKELRFDFNGVVYKATRLFDNDEKTYITEAPNGDNGYHVPEKELLQYIEEKCLANRKMLSSIYGEYSKEGPAG
jgi:hypothetical protein